MSFILAAALLFVLYSASASLLLLLPVVVAAESLHNTSLRVARRFWLIGAGLPALFGLIATVTALVVSGDPTGDPHHAEIRTRPHVCLAQFTALADAPFRYRLYALVAVGLVLFALVRLVWALVTSLRAQRLADRLREVAEPVAGTPVLTVETEEADCFTIGLSRPLVIMTEGLPAVLSADEVQSVVAHEQCHVQHRDVPAELLLRAVTDGLIFLPSTHYYLHQARATIERHCDAAAAATAGPEPLISALRKMDELKRARQVHLQGDLAPLRPTFPGYANPRTRLAALSTAEGPSLALPLPVIIGIELALLLAAIAWLADPLHDTLYCWADALLRVLGG